ncbi:MAG: hypothetical protein PVH19_12265 [Planctomycetia bacterium]|jgi:hypothetical protein
MKNSAKRIGMVVLLVWACSWALPVLAQKSARVGIEETKVKRGWGPEQATGAPDTPRAGDIQTAWASLQPDGGEEWLKVDFEKATNVAEVRIRETFNPGAISKVVAILEDGKEHVLWKGQEPATTAPSYFTVQVDADVTSKSIKIYLDTKRKHGWNEIDAVELVGKDKTRQWAIKASASSTYAVRTQPTARPTYQITKPVYRQRPSDPFQEFYQKNVLVHLEEEKAVNGLLLRKTQGFLIIKRPGVDKTLLVNVQKIVYLETIGNELTDVFNPGPLNIRVNR